MSHLDEKGRPRTFCSNKCKMIDRNNRARLRNLYKNITSSWRNIFISLNKLNGMPTCDICLMVITDPTNEGKLDLCKNCFSVVQEMKKK